MHLLSIVFLLRSFSQNLLATLPRKVGKPCIGTPVTVPRRRSPLLAPRDQVVPGHGGLHHEVCDLCASPRCPRRHGVRGDGADGRLLQRGDGGDGHGTR